MRRKVTWAVLAIVASLWPSIGHAGPIFVGYPPPEGAPPVTFSAAGSLTGTDPSTGAGRIRSYGGFTPAGNWDALYFNIETGTLDGSTTNPSIGPVSFNDDYFGVDGGFGWGPQSHFGNNVTVNMSTGWSFFDFATSSYTAPVDVHLKLDFFDSSMNPLLAGDIISTVPGDGMPLFVLDITPAKLLAWGGGFKVEQLYYVDGGIDASAWFGSHNGGAGNLSASTTGAFWYDPPTSGEVPEPGSLILLGTGCIAAARRMRRGKQVEHA